MKILVLGSDQTIFDEDSGAAKRVGEYASLVEKYTVIVPSSAAKEKRLAENSLLFGAAAPLKALNFVKIYFLAKNILAGEKYDVITVPDSYYSALLGLVLARQFKTGLEVQIHGWEKLGGLRKIIAQYVLPRASIIRVVSQRLKKQLIDEFKIAEDKIIVFPIYVEGINVGQSASREKNADQFIFLTIGRLVPVKNISIQIKALKEVVKKYPQAQLWIVGEGPERKKLESLVDSLGLKEKVKFFGHQKEISRFYCQADVFLLTSKAEGWPLVIVEAASVALPIIMSDVGSAGELIKDRKSGRVVPVNNQGMLIQAMLELLEDEKLRKQLGENARQAFLNLPSKQEILNLYQESWRRACLK